MRDPQTITVNDERMIPVWSIILASVAFVAVEYYFWLVLPEVQHHTPPLGFRIYFNLSWGVLAALYFLMVGYISKDAPRRAMSTWFWMLVCLVMLPGGIGAVFYFLLRQPMVSLCPACGTHVQSDFHFCPQCNYQLLANCGHCFRTVRATDQFCTRCGHELASDHMPARLRALSE